MPLQPGQRIGAYEIVGAIGAGGMGEVYRARDTRLHRDVALKILPATFALDPDRIARFEREAQVLASLNHTNIAGIYGLEEAVGIKALALELVEGPTLADRIVEGPISVDDALAIARQIADALEAAHEAGVVHRDLKPANIKLRPDGTVKVLDFGLAKLTTGPGQASGLDVTASPTITTPAMTSVGVILGTAAYMAPEQARGKPVDKRADIWAFGCVLFEMLAGRRAFDGEDITTTLASIIKSEPDWSAIPPDTPAALQTVLKRCLHKDQRQRLRDIGDARLALDGAFESSGAAVPEQHARRNMPVWRRPAVAVIAALLAGAAAAGLSVWFAIRPIPAPVTKLTITHAGREVVGATNDLVITPDGRRVIYQASAEGRSYMFSRTLDTLTPTRIGNVELPDTLFMSPDGQWVGFQDVADGSLKKIPIGGGPALMIGSLPPNTGFAGATWATNDTIVFGSTTAGLWRVSDGGGTPELLTKVDSTKGELSHRYPQFLPGGQALVFAILTSDNQLENARITVLDLRTGTQKDLLQGASFPRYAASGHLVYTIPGALRAVRFDLDRLEVLGNPVTVLEDIETSAQGSASLAISSAGTLTYVAGRAVTAQRTLVWVDRQGREEPIPVPTRTYAYARLSPDGTRIAVDIREDMNDIWIWDVARQTLTRLTRHPELDRGATWTPDGRRIAFTATRGGVNTVLWQPADGSSAAEPMSKVADFEIPDSFSPDGTKVLFTDSAIRPYSIGVLSLAGEHKTELILNEEFSENNPMFSPDGRWIAYQSDESGRDEIYVRPFPDVTTARWQISTEGGTRPMWSRNGSELFYYVAPGTVMSVSVQTQPTFAATTPQVVFKGSYESPFAGRTYDVTADGRRFLMIKAAPQIGETPSRQLVVVQNWFEELKRLVPVN